MPFPWVIVGGAGYDVEEVSNPRTRDMVCPACEKHVRFVEKQLVKNLRVFGVPLVGIEKGRRVFECPHCRACVEQPAAEPDAEGTAPDTEALRALRERLVRLQDEQWLWRGRAELAEKRGETDLAAEALRLAVRAEREIAQVELEIRRARAAPPPPAPPAEPTQSASTPASASASTPASPSASAPEAPPSPSASGAIAPQEPAVDDEFAALKARLARKTPPGSAEEPAAPPPSPERAPRDASPPSTEPAAPSASASNGASGRSTAAPADDDGDFAALKARLASRGGSAGAESAGAKDPGALDAIRRELSAPPDATPAAPASGRDVGGAPPPPEDDDDPAAALKRKLRKK